MWKIYLLHSQDPEKNWHRSSAETNTFSSSMSQFWTILIETLFSILLVFRPGLPPFTMNLILWFDTRKKFTYKVYVNKTNAYIICLTH